MVVISLSAQSMMLRYLAGLFQELGFVVDSDTMTFRHRDGSVIEVVPARPYRSRPGKGR